MKNPRNIRGLNFYLTVIYFELLFPLDYKYNKNININQKHKYKTIAKTMNNTILKMAQGDCTTRF
ncbi:Uncharacterised protein [Yersinia nurmii]|uniref:Uncharacterized protein n=1 Tax=Yersinia nurmii TaxID=685706 RepID=A0ABM9S3J6_9GAMM|nr:Uncharacterised protein [Yersinia nurmii]